MSKKLSCFPGQNAWPKKGGGSHFHQPVQLASGIVSAFVRASQHPCQTFVRLTISLATQATFLQVTEPSWFCSLFICNILSTSQNINHYLVNQYQSGFHLTVERDWFWFWFWFYYAVWLASVFTLVLVLRQSSENRSSHANKAYVVVVNLLCPIFSI